MTFFRELPRNQSHTVAMPTKASFEIQADAPRNLLRIRFLGHVTPARMQACLAAVESHLPKMRAGFTLLTDLSGLDEMDLDCVTALTKTMDRMRASGVGLVVRVVPDPSKDIGLKILSIIHYRRGVRIVTCETPAEAERALPSA
jgi:anti-anti-sigma regulatory factor